MTANTAASRSGSRWSGGTRNGIPASLILRLARTSRWAIVGSGTRNARAISPVDRPPRVRRVRATWASVASAGWQQVKTSSSRSSGNVVASTSTSFSAASGTASSRVLVVSLVEAVAADRLLHLDERAIGGQRLAVLHAHGGRRLGVAHPDARGDAGGLVERLVGRVDRALLLVGEAIPLLRPRQRGR